MFDRRDSAVADILIFQTTFPASYVQGRLPGMASTVMAVIVFCTSSQTFSNTCGMIINRSTHAIYRRTVRAVRRTNYRRVLIILLGHCRCVMKRELVIGDLTVAFPLAIGDGKRSCKKRLFGMKL